MSQPVQLGFQGLLDAGHTPAEAWRIIRADLNAEPGALRVIRGLEATPEGRAALAWSRQQWAAHGLTPPWEDAPDEPPH
jgi:hypothetical protein